MDAKKLVIDITKKRAYVTVDETLIGGIQKLQLTIDAGNPDHPVSGTVKYWKKRGESEPMDLETVKAGMSSCFGPYSVSFDMNNYEQVSAAIDIIEDPLGEYDDPDDTNTQG